MNWFALVAIAVIFAAAAAVLGLAAWLVIEGHPWFGFVFLVFGGSALSSVEVRHGRK